MKTHGLEAIDRIRTFLIEGGGKAASVGACVSISCFCIYVIASGQEDSAVDLGPRIAAILWIVFSAISLLIAFPSYYLLKAVVPKSFQTGLYHFYTGLIAGSVLPLVDLFVGL